MPLYEYQCGQCGRFELIRRFSDAPLTVCPTCGSAVHKLPSAPAIQFKGTGWYITDYARKSTGGADGKPSTSGETGSGKDAGAGKDSATDKKTGSTDASSTPKDATSKDSSAPGSGSK